MQRSKRSVFGNQFDQGTLTQFDLANIHLCLPGPRCCFGRGIGGGGVRQNGRAGKMLGERGSAAGRALGRKDVALELGWRDGQGLGRNRQGVRRAEDGTPGPAKRRSEEWALCGLLDTGLRVEMN